jgi:hypothetical protein
VQQFSSALKETPPLAGQLWAVFLLHRIVMKGQFKQGSGEDSYGSHECPGSHGAEVSPHVRASG